MGPWGAGQRPLELIGEVIDQGIEHLIVLDLSAVGVNRGVPTASLCHTVKQRWPDVQIWTGGGVRDISDLHRMAIAQVDGVLVASALHEGRITPDDWQAFRTLSDDNLMQAMEA